MHWVMRALSLVGSFLMLAACDAPCTGCEDVDAGRASVDAAGTDGSLVDAAALDAARVDGAAPELDAGARPRRVLVFTRTAGFRHSSIGPGYDAIEAELATLSISAERSEELSALTDDNLARFAAVVFLSTTGDVLDSDAEGALQRYVEGEGGWVGIHAAADCEYEWPWYRTLVGALFARHPAVQSASLVVEDGTHPATVHLPMRWDRTDEWYDFRTNPRSEVEVLITIDESTYSGGGMGADHPMAWAHEVGAGRSFYTALGHTDASYGEPLFREHLRRAIVWAARLE